jgi:hypothetical protein
VLLANIGAIGPKGTAAPTGLTIAVEGDNGTMSFKMEY